MRARAPIFFAMVALAGCLGDRPAPPELSRRPPPPAPAFASPNGEPLTSGPAGQGCDALMAQWFDRADRSRDGFLDLAEFKADAARWFALADLDHDGVVTPSELATLRARLAPGLREAPPGAPAPDTGAAPRLPKPASAAPVLNAGPGGGQGGPPGRRPDGGLPPGSGRETRTDPFMAADTNLDFRVTPEEFQALAERRFAALDTGRTGRLDKARVVATCEHMSR